MGKLSLREKRNNRQFGLLGLGEAGTYTTRARWMLPILMWGFAALQPYLTFMGVPCESRHWMSKRDLKVDKEWQSGGYRAAVSGAQIPEGSERSGELSMVVVYLDPQHPRG